MTMPSSSSSTSVAMKHWRRKYSLDTSHAPRAADFPTLRVRAEVAIVGVCTALPTPLFQASGLVGEAQLARLESLLLELRERDLFRVVLVHHPITEVELEPRRRLRDADALFEVLKRAGAGLVLHGHRHRTIIAQTPGPEGEIPVVGARSASDVGEKESKRAHYHLYGIERTEAGEGSRYRITLRIRGWDIASREAFELAGDPGGQLAPCPGSGGLRARSADQGRHPTRLLPGRGRLEGAGLSARPPDHATRGRRPGGRLIAIAGIASEACAWRFAAACSGTKGSDPYFIPIIPCII